MNDFETKMEQRFEGREQNFRRFDNSKNRKWTGLFVILIGLAALAKNYLVTLPYWLFSWPMILIAVGIFMGLRHNFRGGGWFFMILLGSGFLLTNFFNIEFDRRLVWPIIFIALGVFMIVKPRKRHWQRPEMEPQTQDNALINFDETPATDDKFIESTSVFGGIKKNVLSKDFKGGEVVNIMGGSEINLSQADIKGRAELEVTQIFGGTKIIVPANWDVKPEMAAIFGGIDDKRVFYNVTVDPSKVLVLKGTSIFGGIEIRSF